MKKIKENVYIYNKKVRDVGAIFGTFIENISIAI